MFKKKFDLSKEGFTNLVAANTRITGDIEFEGVIRVCGSVSGNVSATIDSANTSGLILEEKSYVSGKAIRAFNIIAGGVVSSEVVWAENEMTILATAKITNATIYYRHLSIEPGAMLNGCILKHLDFVSEGEVT